jgi:hypothetical protein
MPNEDDGWFVTWKWWIREKTFDWIWDHLKNAAWFRAVIVDALSVITGVWNQIWNQGDPRWFYGCVGAIIASSLILFPTGLQAIIRYYAGSKPLVPDERYPQFYRLKNAETVVGLGLVMEINARTEHDMTEVLIAYRAVVSNWNGFWAELTKALRRCRNDEERRAITVAINKRYQEPRHVASEALERRMEYALSGMKTLYDDSGRPVRDG